MCEILWKNSRKILLTKYHIILYNILVVSASGKIIIEGCGKTTITVKASRTEEYKAAQKKITITVKPATVKLSSVKSKKSRTMTVKWKKDSHASGYILQYSTDKEFEKKVKSVTISSKKVTSMQIGKLKAGKKYYVRICAYKKVSGGKLKGNYSVVKSVTIKK